MLEQQVLPGPTLEVGAGSGFLKEFWTRDLICSDVIQTPWVDLQLDALKMDSIQDASFQNIVGIDTLHHFDRPETFLAESARILKPGGRLVMIEPWLTPLSRPLYKIMHHEDIYTKAYVRPGQENNPWYGNLALLQVLLKNEPLWKTKIPHLELGSLQPMSFLDFQTAGGFRNWSLFHGRNTVDFCLRIDQYLKPLMPLLGFRALVIWTKR